MDTSYYTNKITNFHRRRPKFHGMITQALQPNVDTWNLLDNFSAYFDLDANMVSTDANYLGVDFSGATYLQQAIGAQLDILGEWINLPRRVVVPVPDPWFRLDDETRGLDVGRFQEPYSFTGTLELLDDDTYRKLLEARVFANRWDGTCEMAYQILIVFFTDPGSYVIVDDHTTGECIYGISGKIPPNVNLEIWQGKYLPLATGGVENLRLITSKDGAPLFGLDTDNQYIGGLDNGAVGVTADIILNNLL